jgi:hypothetical protein
MDVSEHILIPKYIYIKIDNNNRRKYYYFRVQMRRRSGGYGSHWSIIWHSDSSGAATIDLLLVITFSVCGLRTESLVGFKTGDWCHLTRVIHASLACAHGPSSCHVQIYNFWIDRS